METLNKIFKAASVKMLDEYTIEYEPVSSLDLMGRAAMVWTRKFLDVLRIPAEVAVVAGNGNNGGDGYCIACLLAEHDWNVTVFRLMPDSTQSVDCKVNYQRWLDMGGQIVDVRQADDFVPGKQAVIVDAILGSGINRKVEGVMGEVIRLINCLANQVVAVDIPSGLMGEDNTLNDRENIIKADYTFTFQFHKLAFLLPENAEYVGEWHVVDIHLDVRAIVNTETCWYYTDKEEVKKLLPVPLKFAHKGLNGCGLLVAGRRGMMGAAVLAAKAALRSGIGLLYCHVPKQEGGILQMSVPEAILDFDSSEEGFSFISGCGRFDAVAVGPGLGQSPETCAGLRRLLKEWRGVTVLDADALNLMSEHPEMLDLLHEKCILTPHPKEFERLAGKSENDFDRLKKLSIFACQYHTYVVLKGAYSAIATPQGKLFFNMSGNPGMAKGGAGDVLTGVLLALAACGMEVFDVVRCGVFAHGLAGDILARQYGYRGISAGMLAEAMSEAWKELEN